MSASLLLKSSAIKRPSAVNFEELLQKLDEQFAAFAPSMIKRFEFTFDGMAFEVRRISQEQSHRFLITATLGYLPFSIESEERRQTLKTIIAAARDLPTLHFSIDTKSKITIGGVFDTETVAPDFIFYPLILFLQEARPFAHLIGRYL